jgi:hypothetical protein
MLFMARVLQLLVLVIAALSVLTVAVPTQAQTTPDDCIALIGEESALGISTAGAAFTNEKDRTGLVGKLDSASAKLTQGKVEGTIQALSDFRAKVETLQSQGKIVPEDAAVLIVEADNALHCLQPDEETPEA